MKENLSNYPLLLIFVVSIMFSACNINTGNNDQHEIITPVTITPVTDFEYEIIDGCAVISRYTGNDTEVYFPETIEGCPVTELVSTQSGIFSNSPSLYHDITKIVLPSTLKIIGEKAFDYCIKLESIGIPDSVTTICSGAFFRCDSLDEIIIPESVTSIEGHPFFGCKNLARINVDPGNKSYMSENGILYDKNQKELICYPGGKSDAYFFPASVETIREYAFYGSLLTSISIPDTIENIGPFTFSYCKKLESINHYSENISYISECMFAFCENLDSFTIPGNITDIRDRAFAYCYSLSEIRIPDSVINMGYSVFSSCTGLSSVMLPEVDTFSTISETCFSGCKNLSKITIPDNVTSIGYGAFVSSGLSAIELPDSVVIIGERAFSECTSLASFTFPPEVKVIEDNTFKGCSSLTEIDIPDGIESIGNNAFNKCSGLTRLMIGNSVKRIGYYAFWDCDELAVIEISVTDPPNAVLAFNPNTMNTDPVVCVPESSDDSIIDAYRSSWQPFADFFQEKQF